MPEELRTQRTGRKGLRLVLAQGWFVPLCLTPGSLPHLWIEPQQLLLCESRQALRGAHCDRVPVRREAGTSQPLCAQVPRAGVALRRSWVR